MYYVYRAIGPTGTYVGYTCDFARRKGEHVKNAGKDATHFHRALAKYPCAGFAWELVLVTKTAADARFCERVVIAQEKRAGSRLYNLTLGGDGACGYRHTPETRARLRETRKLQVMTPRSHEALLRFSKQPKSSQHRARIGAANKGKIRSEETRLKLSLAAKARDPLTRKASPETRAKLALLARGRKRSPETRAKLSAIARARKLSAETKAKISLGGQASWARRRAEGAA